MPTGTLSRTSRPCRTRSEASVRSEYEAQPAVVTGRLRQVDQHAEHPALDQPAEKGPESTDGASVSRPAPTQMTSL
jgi:hypothetical protein